MATLAKNAGGNSGPPDQGMRIAHARVMDTFCDDIFFSSSRPFLRNSQGLKIFLRVRQTSSGPPDKFQGAIMIEPGEGRSSELGMAGEVRCPLHCSTHTDATLDAMNLAQAMFAVVDTA